MYSILLGEKISFCLFKVKAWSQLQEASDTQLPQNAFCPKCQFDVNLCPLCPPRQCTCFKIHVRIKLLPFFFFFAEMASKHSTSANNLHCLQTTAKLASSEFAAVTVPICFSNMYILLWKRPSCIKLTLVSIYKCVLLEPPAQCLHSLVIGRVWLHHNVLQRIFSTYPKFSSSYTHVVKCPGIVFLIREENGVIVVV